MKTWTACSPPDDRNRLWWIVSPVCQGQIVEVAYAFDMQGGLYRRTHDRSSGEVFYAYRPARIDDDPVNGQPS